MRGHAYRRNDKGVGVIPDPMQLQCRYGAGLNLATLPWC